MGGGAIDGSAGRAGAGFGCKCGSGAALVGGFDGWWRDWWVAAVGGCRLLVRLSLSVFRLVLVMVSLVVQMVGGG